MQIFPGWQEYKDKPLLERLEVLSRAKKPVSNLLFAQQLSRQYTAELFEIADKIRKIAKNKHGKDYLQTLLSDKRAMLFFVQPSTRTFLSFLNACHILGIKTSEIRDTNTSSEIKGESPEDTIRTFSSYVDLIVVRHKEEGFAEKSAWVLSNSNRPVPIINGGSGKDEHPTQALLDLYTINHGFSKKGGIDGKKIAMCGDLKRGRTIRSLSQLLANYKDIEITFVAPKEYQMKDDILSFLKERNVPYKLTDDFEGAIKEADAIYLTRIQDEYDENGESKKVDYTKFQLEKRHLPLLKSDSIIMHPFPRRMEIDVAIDNDPRAHYWKQARNGMWVRAALILKILGRAKWINDYKKED